MASDDKLRCAIVYRLEGAGPTAVTLAQLDYLKEVETHKKDAEGEEGLYGGKKANFAKAVARVVGNDPPTGVSKGQKVGGFKVVQSDEHQVVYGADLEGICYCVITGLKYPNRIAIKFLEELGEEMQKTIGHDVMKKAKENSLTSRKDSKKVLKAMCTKFETPQSTDSASKVIAAVDKVKGQMQSNIAGMMKNQESAESLNEKSAQLNEQAGVFKKNAKTLKKAMWWKNMKTTLMLGCVVVIVGILLLLPLITNVGSAVAMFSGGGGGESGGGESSTSAERSGGGRRLWSMMVVMDLEDDGFDPDKDADSDIMDPDIQKKYEEYEKFYGEDLPDLEDVYFSAEAFGEVEEVVEEEETSGVW